MWFALPLVPVALWAFADRWSWPAALPQQWGLSGWRQASDAGLPVALVQSDRPRSCSWPAVATPLGALAGRALGWRLSRHSGLASLVLLTPVVIPPFAVATGLDTLVLRARVPAPVAVVLVLSVLALPYTSYIMRAAYTATDPDLEAQARMLGAGPRGVLWRVTLPALRPALLTAGAMAFLVGWSDYVVTLVLGGGRVVTAPILLASSASGTGNEPLVAAIAVAGVAAPARRGRAGPRLRPPASD